MTTEADNGTTSTTTTAVALPEQPRERLTMRLELPDGTLRVLDLDPSLLTVPEHAYKLRVQLGVMAGVLGKVGRYLEAIIERDMAARGATERLIDGFVYAYKGDKVWQQETETLRLALVLLLEAGEISQGDYDDMVTVRIPEPVVSIHNGKLSTLERKRGKVVADAVAPHRRQVETPAKLTISQAK